MEAPARLLQLELRLPGSLAMDRVMSEAASRYKSHFAQKGIDVFYTRKFYENVEWKRFGMIPNRPISTIRLAGGIETELLADARKFLEPNTEAIYAVFGRPYKRVYCLHGPPGTGKTSLIMAIASELSRPVAIFNVDSLRDDTFIELLSDLPEGAVIIFEDIDAMFKKRGGGGEDGGMTFSTLLNSLDGVLHPRRTLIFMTTNHLERLDPALHRPGRVDRMVEVPYARSAQVASLWRIAFPKGPAMPRDLVRAADVGNGVSPALTSEVLFTRRTEGPAAAAAALLSAWGDKGSG
jgi:chaperone BCS1